MTLFVEGPYFFNVTEPDSGNNSETLIVRFRANISEPLSRDVMFRLLPNVTSTASFNNDYNLTNQTLTIPTNFSGEFVTYVGIVILGDDEVEDDEFLELLVTPLLPEDEVLFLDVDEDSITVYIEDNDGTCGKKGAKSPA